MTRFLASTKLTVALCLILAADGVAGSVLYPGNTSAARQGHMNVFRSPLFLVPALLLLVNILSCAAKRLPALSLRSLRGLTFAGIHLGIVLLVSGLAVDGLFGFVGTKNFYLGIPESSYLDWRSGREESFPFTIEITRARTLYHPLNLKVEVRDGRGSPVGVYTVREGATFLAGNTGIAVTPRRFERESGTLVFDASVGGRSSKDLRAAVSGVPVEGGYVVAPVAFADPEPMEHVAAVRFTAAGGPPEDREIRINAPAVYSGTTFCLVAMGEDRYGNPYAGLQMTREPGGPIFWAGALLFVLSLAGRFRGKRAEPAAAPGEAGKDSVPRVTAGIAVLLAAAAFASAAEASGAAIGNDLTWSGEVRVASPVTVARGATLRILPGTRVLLSGEDRDGDGLPDGLLTVHGTLLVEGERDRPVRFVRLHPDRPWAEVFLSDARAVIRYAVFAGGAWGLHVHDGDVRVEQAVFEGNGGGARLRGTGAAFARCTFRDNGIGLRFRDGGPEVRSSSIEGNETGLFYRQGSGGGNISGNRIANREWDLKLGDWADGGLDASRNFWPAGSPKVGDFRESKEEGRLVLLPSLPAPPEPCGADISGGAKRGVNEGEADEGR